MMFPDVYTRCRVGFDEATRCALTEGHWGFHKSFGAIQAELALAPEECEAMERERWAMRRRMDGDA